MFNKGSIVVIDDDQEMKSLMTEFLESNGYEVRSFSLAADAFEEAKRQVAECGTWLGVDLIISDIQMPEMDGIELTQRLKKMAPEIPVILVTAFGSIEAAIEATKQGAQDYIVKPFKLSELGVRVDKAVQLRQLKKENEILRKEVKKNWTYGQMIGKSRAMKSVFEMIDRVAGATANVFIQGESGTGKELVARAIHEQGPRRNGPFVAINCTAIPDTLLESELFGHAKGAFTGAIQRKKGLFEEAHGGTLFLDEIGDLDMNLQAKLLRVLQEKRIKPVGDNEYKDIDVRIVCATHKDLQKAVKEDLFREDLYYRLSVIPLVIPPLRHRREDIPLLANFFLEKFMASNHSPVRGFTQGAILKLMNATWDGNVRELENLIERVVVLTNKALIDADDLPLGEAASSQDFFASAEIDLPTLEQLEKRYMKHVLEKVGGKKEKAAQILGINRRTLYRKEREYGFVDEIDPSMEDEAVAETK
jgi:DNA-binding NtrC family response regulator